MPRVKANQITINYDQQGTGEPLILIPFLAADYACYAFQVAEYAKHFTCISIDLRGTGESDKPEGVYSTELFADDIAAFMQALGIPTPSSRLRTRSNMSFNKLTADGLFPMSCVRKSLPGIT